MLPRQLAHVVLVASLVFAAAAVATLPACSTGRPLRGQDASTVTIGQPAVYARERYIQERFDDIEWLRAQLEKMDDYEQGYQGTARSTVSEQLGVALSILFNADGDLKLANTPADGTENNESTKDEAETPNEGGQADAGAQDAKKGSNDDGEVIDPKELALAELLKGLDKDTIAQLLAAPSNRSGLDRTPQDRLDDRLAFRDGVRAAMRQRTLDDVHDTSGFTLYELQFDLTLTPGRDSGNPVLIALTVCDDQDDVDSKIANVVADALVREAQAEAFNGQRRLVANAVTTRDAWASEALARGLFAARIEGLYGLREYLARINANLLKICDGQEDIAKEINRLNTEKNPAHQGLHDRITQTLSLCERPIDLPVLPSDKLMVIKRVLNPNVPLADSSGGYFDSEGFYEQLQLASDALVRQRRRIYDISRDLLEADMEITRIIEEQGDDPKDKRAKSADLDAKATLASATREFYTWQSPVLSSMAERTSDTVTQIELIQSARDAGHEEAFTAAATSFNPAVIGAGGVTSVATGVSSAPPPVAASGRFQNVVNTISEGRSISEREVDVVRTLLNEPDPTRIYEFAGRAAALLIQADYIRRASPQIDWIDPTDPVGPLILTGTRFEAMPRIKATPNGDVFLKALPECVAPMVITVSPSEQFEQLSVSARSLIQRALSLSASGRLSAAAAGDAELQYLREELREYEMIQRNPLLVGFLHAPGVGLYYDSYPQFAPHDALPHSTFGWIVGPRLETRQPGFGGAELWYRQSTVHNAVTATLLVPAWFSNVHFDVQAFEIARNGDWRPIAARLRAPKHQHARVVSQGRFKVELPIDTETVAQWLVYGRDRTAAEPIVASPFRASSTLANWETNWELRAGDPGSILIQGSNVWRNPEVYVGGQRADRVRILSDLNGLYAEFDRVTAPPGLADRPIRATLVVSTSTGQDTIADAVTIHPPKPKPTSAPLPKVTLAATAAIARVAPGSATDQTIDLAFNLDEPFPERWSNLRLRIRVLNNTDVIVDETLPSAAIPVSINARRLAIAGVPLKKSGAQNSDLAAADVKDYEIDLWIVESPRAEPRRITASSLELTAFGSGSFELTERRPLKLRVTVETDKPIVTAAETMVTARCAASLPQLKNLLPSLASGAPNATVTLGDVKIDAPVTITPAANDPTKSLFTIRIPAGTKLPVKKETSGFKPATLALAVTVGAQRFSLGELTIEE